MADGAMMAEAVRMYSEALLRSKLSLFRFHVKQQEVVVPTESIICATCCAKGVSLYTVHRHYHNIRRTLASMDTLRECGFLRIHLGAVLNMAYYRGRDVDRIITLSQDVPVTLKVSLRHLPTLNRFLNDLCY